MPSCWRQSAGASRAPNPRPYELEERILLAQGAPAANLHQDTPLALALLHRSILEGVHAAGVLEGGARGDGGGTVAGEREEVARDPGAGAVSVSIRRVCALLSMLSTFTRGHEIPEFSGAST
jgi:hypothetical protein